MRSRTLRAVTALLMMISALATAGADAPVDRPGASNEHQRIVEFWTNERVAQATPRDFVLTQSGRFELKGPPPGKGPGSGGEDDGGSSSGTTGASWNTGGAVADTTGKVLFSMGGSYYVCSASVVTEGAGDRSIILTAAHCAFDEAGGEFAENWMFIPNYDADPVSLDTAGDFCGATLHGCWTADSLVVHDGYASAGGFNNQAVVYDFAFAVVSSGGKDGDLVQDVVGTQDIAFIGYDGTTVMDAFGYPAAQKYKGKDLVYCEGVIGFDPNVPVNGTYKLPCDMTGGSSGGPWFSTFDKTTGTGTLSSLNSYGYSGDKSMHGPKFNLSTQALFAEALTTEGNSIIGS